MRTLAESLYTANPSTYAQYLDEGETGVTQNNYFRIASLERLGTAQDAQFQSGDQYGSSWHWGSKLNESGELLDGNDLVNVGTEGAPQYTPRNHSPNNATAMPQHSGTASSIPGRVWVENNSRSEIPRGYHDNNVCLLYTSDAADE